MDNSYLVAMFAIQAAQTQTALSSLKALSKEMNVETIEGKPVETWIQERADVELQNVLIMMENMNPGAAAQTQQMINLIWKKLRGNA